MDVGGNRSRSRRVARGSRPRPRTARGLAAPGTIAGLAALLALAPGGPGGTDAFAADETTASSAPAAAATPDGTPVPAADGEEGASRAPSPAASPAVSDGSMLAACTGGSTGAPPCTPDASRAAAVAAALSAASLEDTKDRRWNLSEIAAQPVLLILAGRKGSDQAVAWGEGIHRRHPEGLAIWATPSDPSAVVVVSDADLHEVPAMLRGVVRWRIGAVIADRERQGRPGPPLLLDWEGVIPRAVGADTSGDAVVVLLDRDRAEHARFSGEPTETTLGELGTAIDALRAGNGAKDAGSRDEGGAR